MISGQPAHVRWLGHSEIAHEFYHLDSWHHRSSNADCSKPEMDSACATGVAQVVSGEVASPLGLGRVVCRA